MLGQLSLKAMESVGHRLGGKGKGVDIGRGTQLVIQRYGDS